MIKQYIVTDGLDAGRVKDIPIAVELAVIEDAWRQENGGVPMNQPPERLGKPEVSFRELIHTELSRLIFEDIAAKAKREPDAVYAIEAAQRADPEENNEDWLRYRMFNQLFSLSEDNGFDDITCYEILDMSFSEAFEAAYSLLTQAGLDADALLADYTESD